MPSNASAVDAIGDIPPAGAPEMDEAKTALSHRVRELEAAEARLQHEAALAAAGQQRAATDPIDRLPASPLTKQWLREHREILDDPRKFNLLQAAHFTAAADGIAVDTPQYFEHLERAVGYHPAAHTPTPEESNMPQFPAPPPARRPLVSAPVSRSGGNFGGGPAPGKIHLSAEEVEWARRSGVTPSEYARNKMKLLRSKAGGNYPDQ
jgi:hypothetical protein